MLASYFTLAARIVRVPVCLWFWIDIRITNWAGQEDFFFFFFWAALDGRRENDKTGQKRSSRHRTSPYREKTIVILRVFRVFDNATRMAAFAHRALGFVVYGESKVAGIKDPDIPVSRRSWIQVVARGVSVLCDILAQESGVPRRITTTIFLVALLLFKFTKTEQTKTKEKF